MNMWARLQSSSKDKLGLAAALFLGVAWGQCGTCIGSNCLNSSASGLWTNAIRGLRVAFA